MASEETPLLDKANVPEPIRVRETGLEPESWLWIGLTLPVSTVYRYWFSILLIALSTVVCIKLDYTKVSVLDPLIFKSIFVIFGFAIGFRNVRANTRRGAAMEHISDFFGSAWGILVIFPDKQRAEVTKELTCLCDIFANHIKLVATRSNYMLGIVGLQPYERPGSVPEDSSSIWQDTILEWPQTTSEAQLSPRTLMMSFLFMCEEKIDELEDSQKMQKAFAAQKATFMKSYDGILHIALPSISDRYAMLIDIILSMFGITFPWGIHGGEDHLNHIKFLHGLPSGWWLVINTIFVVLVFFGLNSLAAEHENPFNGDWDDLHFRKLVNLFKDAVTGYEAHRIAYRKQNSGATLTHLEEHRLICGAAGANQDSTEAATYS
mmetsp:Transcript_137135/g.242408  ORF Transcript_137135/g.242408 Transcript_137135/m.242408 type:complete len:378 (+) Transcript_137135:43-1176(+)